MCINNKSQVVYKLYTNDDVEVNNDDKDNDDDADDFDVKENNLKFHHHQRQCQNKKQVMVYYKPTSSNKSYFEGASSKSYFLQNLAHNFMFLCFCRSHHYHQRRLGTF